MISFATKNKIATALLIGAVALASLSILAFAPRITDANQSEFCLNQLNGSATTSKSYITAGAATTTQTVTNCSDGSTAFESATVALQIISSTTPPSLTARYEVSRDGIDWYPYPVQVAAATSSLVSTVANEYKFQAMASSTSDMAGSGLASSTAGTPTNLQGALFMQTLVLPSTPFPYFRLKYYVPAGAPAVAISADVLVKREKLAR